MPDVLFVSERNAGRSLIAAALFNREAAGRFTAESAGLDPADRPDDGAVEALAEVGLEVEDKPGRLLTQDLAESASRVVAIDCDVHVVLPGLTTPVIRWDVDVPQGLSSEQVRAVRDDLADRVRALFEELEEYHPY